MNRYRIVADACIIDDPECYHHDIISYYGCDEDEYTVRCVIEEEEYWVEIHLLGSDIFVVIDPDIWYVC